MAPEMNRNYKNTMPTQPNDKIRDNSSKTIVMPCIKYCVKMLSRRGTRNESKYPRFKTKTVVVSARSIRTGPSVMSLIMSFFKTFHRVEYTFLFRNFRYLPVSSTWSRRWDRCSRSYQPSPL